MGFFGQNRLSEKLMQIDQKYLRKVFERYPEAGDEQILHTFNRLQQKWVANLLTPWRGGGMDNILPVFRVRAFFSF